MERIPEAWLVAIKDNGPLTDFDRLTLHQAVTIVALELLRGRVAGDTERRLAGDVLAAIVDGELAGPELARRLEPFGLADRVAALVVQRPNNGRGSPAPVEDALSRRCARRPRRGSSRRRARSPVRWSRAWTRRTCSGLPGGSREDFTTASGPACASVLDAQSRAVRRGAASTRDAARWRRWHSG